MQEIHIGGNEAGQRLDKLLAKYLNEAPKSFIYKMLRKKNIVLNGKKATGNEKLIAGDSIKLFLADDTITKFSSTLKVVKSQVKLDIIYEDRDVLFLNKPVGMLSQKGRESDVSVVEHLISYLIESNQLTEADLRSFRPSICNRLDRNTSGLLVAGKSLKGLQTMAELFKDRSLGKFYRCLVVGEVKKPSYIKGYLKKEEKTNKVTIVTDQEYVHMNKLSVTGSTINRKEHLGEYVPIETSYKPIRTNGKVTLLEVHLITGKTHQIRAHLSSTGHPIIGDYKYGNKHINDEYKTFFGLQSQLLHAYRLEFPTMSELTQLSGKTFVAPLSKRFETILETI